MKNKYVILLAVFLTNGTFVETIYYVVYIKEEIEKEFLALLCDEYSYLFY